MRSSNQVVITGMGVLAPNGIGKEAFWESILACRSGVGPITLFDASAFKSRIAGEVKNFRLSDFHKPTVHTKNLARHTELALAAARLAVTDAGLDGYAGDSQLAIPVVLGVSTSAMEIVADGMFRFQDDGPGRVPAHIVVAGMPQQAAMVVADELGFPTTAQTVSSACASGLDAMSVALSHIRSGYADVALAGGTDAPISPTFFAFLDKAGLASRRNEMAERASAPFDRGTDSGVISEGAAVVVMENLQHALARGAPIYAVLAGYGTRGNDVAPKVLTGLLRAMEMALGNAGRRRNDVDYICAHGPGHPVIDKLEVDVLRQFFGDRIRHIPVSSIKGVIGNALAATGPMQVMATVLAIRDNMLPPTANFESAHPDRELDFVAGYPRPTRVDCALVNLHGLGGNNSCMVVERALGV